MQVSVDQMRVAVAVAHTRSFSRAGESLGLGQPVVSRTVRTMEHTLGTVLFTRTSRRVELTDAGTRFIEIAAQVLAAYDLGSRAWSDYLEAASGSVAVAALPGVAASTLPPALATFAAERPGCTVHIRDVPSAEALRLVRHGRVDMAVCDSATVLPLSDDRLRVRELGAEPLVAVVPPGHRWAEATTLTWDELSTEPFLALETGSSVRSLTDGAFASVGRTPQTVLVTRNTATLAAMVSEGLGVSAVPVGVLPLMRSVDVALVPLIEPAVQRRMCLVAHRESTLSPIANALFTHLAASLVDRSSSSGRP